MNMDMNRIIATAAVLAATACGGRCTEGATQACACQGGLTGVQTCTAESAFGTCDCGQLSEAEARRLVEAQADFTDGVMCGVQVREFAHGRYSLSSIPRNACLEALVGANIVARGGLAIDTVSETEILPIGDAHVDGIWLHFPCGSVSLSSVMGITTTGSSASFRYDREVVLDHAVVDAVSDCRLDVAAAGHAERERTARRDDAGHWSLVTATR